MPGNTRRCRDAHALVAEAFRVAWAPTWTNVLHWVSWSIALSVELVTLVLLWDGGVPEWDVEVTRFLEKLPQREAVFAASNYLTNTLAPHFMAAFVVVVGITLLARRWLAGTLLALTFPLHVLAQFPKALVERPRPSQYDGGPGDFRSYPSGHAEYVITFYGLVVYLVLGRLRSPRLRVALVATWLALVVSVGLGRVATGRHWPSDILVSYVVGLGLLSGLVWIARSVRAAQARVRGEAAEASTRA